MTTDKSRKKNGIRYQSVVRKRFAVQANAQTAHMVTPDHSCQPA
ncbi:hypothetical protein RISK_001981 [Rhodopirellula islandica]|uniref:Uncharacterized protein n=1 Tax=Rhodopirellula islandica TaxID=595434 RepID=A0A0J1BHW2_RHOIS|nr:hypothetical protein RISK_001981 [Rhodopirellula islandica]